MLIAAAIGRIWLYVINSKLAEVEKKMKNLLEKFPVMLSYVSDKRCEEEIEEIKARYDHLVTAKDNTSRR